MLKVHKRTKTVNRFCSFTESTFHVNLNFNFYEDIGFSRFMLSRNINRLSKAKKLAFQGKVGSNEDLRA